MSLVEEKIENIDNENLAEKERVNMELAKIDEVKDILEKRYHYGVIKDFIDHLASTEKVFLLAGIKNFGGDEIMDMFIKSETRVMSSDTGIEEDVFSHIKKEFSETHKTVSEIKNISNMLIKKYPESEKFIEYMEEYLIILLEASLGVQKIDFNIDREKETVIHEMMVKIAENDNAEIQELEKVYQEFKNELKKIEE